MGDFRLSVEIKIDLGPASATKAEQKRGYEHEKPLSMYINYYPDRQEEVVKAVTDYLDRAWSAARWNLDEAYRESQERQELQATIDRSNRLQQEAAQAAIDAQKAQDALNKRTH